jgi:putative nucleotidyltransferase with HDIG domain
LKKVHIKPEYKVWIEHQLELFQAYDDLRPANRTYKFVDHSKRVAENMRALSLKMGQGKDMAEALYWATLIHDIGKMQMPVEIWDYDVRDENGVWQKPPEALKAERRRHTILGAEYMRQHFGQTCETEPFLKLCCDLMLYHHEQLDGHGYPGIKSKDLSIHERMISICDAFDGWTIARPHKTKDEIDPINVLNKKMADGRFDQSILKYLKEIILCSSKHFSLSPSS